MHFRDAAMPFVIPPPPRHVDSLRLPPRSAQPRQKLAPPRAARALSERGYITTAFALDPPENHPSLLRRRIQHLVQSGPTIQFDYPHNFLRVAFQDHYLESHDAVDFEDE